MILDLAERLEYAVDMAGGDAAPGIADRNAERIIACRRDGDGTAVLVELDGVRQDMDERLLHSVRVEPDQKVLGRFVADGDRLCIGVGRDGADRGVDDLVE